MKTAIFTFLIIFISLLSFFLGTIAGNQDIWVKKEKTDIQKSTTSASNKLSEEISSPSSQEKPVSEDQNNGYPTAPIEPTDEQLAEYVKVYKEPAVLFLRKALDAYRQETYDDDMIAFTAIEKSDLNGKPSGLDSFEEYHQSKFVVYSITNNIMGGLNIHIIFVDKPDQIFTAWVYERAEGDFDLRGFWANPPEDQEKFNGLVEYLRPLLENEELSV